MILQRTVSALALALIVGVSGAALAQTSNSHGDPALLKQAKITHDAAQKIALRAQPGTVKDWEVEKESGGSGLRYSFDIEKAGKIHEVGVDAADGKILENVVETADDEAREAKEEAREPATHY